MSFYYCEPYRIKMVEPIKPSTKIERKEWLANVGYNLLSLSSEQVFIDLLTDSGTGAMSQEQWAEVMKGDESYAGSTSFYKLKEIVEKLFDMPYLLPVHQGRAAENVLFSTLLKPGDVIPGNSHFETTKGHIFFRHAKPIDCTIDEGFEISNAHLFKGNIDLNKLEAVFKAYPKEHIPLVLLTITCNSTGGQPVSMQNIKAVSALCQQYNCPLFFDAARFAENAYFIKLRESDYQNKSIREIVKEMFSYVDGFTMSAKKDAIVNMGGLLGLRSERLYDRASEFIIRFEGFVSYGGLAGRDLAALAQGLLEGTDYNYLEARIKQVSYLGELLSAAHIPVIQPFGGHAVFIDAKSFLPYISQTEYPGYLLATEIYLAGGIRCSGSSALSMDRDEAGKEVYPPLELVRLAIPWRTYTDNHMHYVADVIKSVYDNRDSLKHGYQIISEKERFRFFTVELKRIE